jgi:SAM-dependent methyltransferase
LINTKRTKFLLNGILTILNNKLRRKPFQYYSDQYWNDLPKIQNYINKSVTDNSDLTWIEDILIRFKQYVPFDQVLVVGSGNGWVERQLYDMGIGKSFDAFDMSDEHLLSAKKLVQDRKINYFKNDLNNLTNLKSKHYDAIFNVGVLHHAFRLSNTMWALHKTLKKNGLMFNFEYVGPAYNQYSDEHLKIIKQINDSLSSRFRSIIPLRPKLSSFQKGDPSEAVHSDILIQSITRFFDILYEREINGGIAYPILWNNIDEFKKMDNNAQKIVELLINEDKKITQNKKIPSLFWYSVVTPKSHNMISNDELLPP